ncbi:4-amino-4-deoxy-L-arabinose transferase [Caulobacter sp. CCUG 60055]|uniref:ArnT family glycosyltransferase n=2 Tax=Pseudomonadota TaxID=1224 RepID=UPI001FA79A6B|nr:glycosyltransferase family 39 protein [Caulobacter sp. CCUG 60055]MBQ1543551.1 glycosyltransferase family 39 protein [Caulobacteraceae bacterium]MCI3181451.1 4-amino-4-deoxy-L-arabinose transferase [Caulobacter sp. CCUG 60055]
MTADGMDERRAWLFAATLIGVLTVARLVTLFVTPIGLYPDEAQYWLWSRVLDWGYFSKPPMIAWLIRATTALGGDGEAWIRLSAPILHAGAALAAFSIGRRLYGPSTGLAAAAVYALMPGVQLSSGVIATDAPLLLFLALALLAYVRLLQEEDARRGAAFAAGIGAAMGLAVLSKYAAAYGLAGFALHLAWSPEARRAWRPARIAAAAAAFGAALAPNMVWNARHHFATVAHTAANANWGADRLFNPGELADFVLSQFAVFGPAPFAVLTVGGAIMALRRRLTPEDRLLLCFTAPALLVVGVQAFVSRANANWAGAAYVAGSVLAAAWLVRWRARGWIAAGLGLQAAAAAVFIVGSVSPKAADALGLGNGLKRARGWSESTQLIVDRARQEQARGGLSAVAVDNRFLFNELAYYGRNYFRAPGAPPLTMWVHEARPRNQAEAETPLTPPAGRRVLAISFEDGYRAEMAQDFASTAGDEIAHVRLDRKNARRLELFVGEDFRPLPRDPVTGLPPKPKSAH